MIRHIRIISTIKKAYNMIKWIMPRLLTALLFIIVFPLTLLIWMFSENPNRLGYTLLPCVRFIYWPRYTKANGFVYMKKMFGMSTYNNMHMFWDWKYHPYKPNLNPDEINQIRLKIDKRLEII